MAKNGRGVVADEASLDIFQNGTESAVRATEPGSVPLFTRDAFLEMQNDRELMPSLAGEDEESYIPLGRPGKSYFTVHPSTEYEWRGVFTFDFRKSDNKREPYLVLPGVWSKFPPSLLRVKRLLLCMSFTDEVQRPFLWLADWHETGETPTELHRSISRVLAKARGNWGQALFEGARGMYVWRQWPVQGLGQAPMPIWPDRDFFEIVQETFHDRVVATPEHELIQAIGREQA